MRSQVKSTEAALYILYNFNKPCILFAHNWIPINQAKAHRRYSRLWVFLRNKLLNASFNQRSLSSQTKCKVILFHFTFFFFKIIHRCSFPCTFFANYTETLYDLCIFLKFLWLYKMLFAINSRYRFMIYVYMHNIMVYGCTTIWLLFLNSTYLKWKMSKLN